MKLKTFKSFLVDYVKDMNPERSLSLFKNEKFTNNDKRLLNVYSFYVLFNSNVEKTLLNKKEKLPRLYNTYRLYKKKYKGFTYENLSEKVNMLDKFDELKQLHNSYKNLVVNKNLLLKKMYHHKIINIKKEKSISNYRIYTDLELNHGNTNDYLKNEKYEKLSINNVKSILEYVTSA
jgi:hypothetical protein